MAYNFDFLTFAERRLPDTGRITPVACFELGHDYHLLGQIIDLSELDPRLAAEDYTGPTVTPNELPGTVKVMIPGNNDLTRRDAHRRPLTWVPAGELTDLDFHQPSPEGVTDTLSRFEIGMATKAYLGALPDKSPVVIYLH